MLLGFEGGNIQNDIKKSCVLRQWGVFGLAYFIESLFAPSFLIGMSEMGLSVVTFCNLTAVIKNGPFYLDIFCCCIL